MASTFKAAVLLLVAFPFAATSTLQKAEIGVRRNGKVEFKGSQVSGHIDTAEVDPVRRVKAVAEAEAQWGSSKVLTPAEIDELDYFGPALGAAPSGLAEGSSTKHNVPGMDDQAVSLPCTGKCLQAAQKGIIFIGDSTTRRLYIRFIARLARLTNDQSEMLQDNAKQWSHSAGNVPLSQFRDATGEVPFAYTKGGMRVRFEWDSQFTPENITKKVMDAQNHSYAFAYVGLPLAHLLHWEGSPSLACDAGPKFATELVSKLEQVVKLDESAQMRLVFGNGVPFANGDRLLNLTCQGLGRMHVEQCTSGVCDWVRCNSHLQKANEAYEQAFDKVSKPHMRRVDITGTTMRSKLWRYRMMGLSDGGVHYKYGMLDEQLDSILKQMLD